MSTSDWRVQPLRNFWQNVNWENRAIAPASISNANNNANNNGNPPVLSLLMSVREYFRAISWTGIPEIAASPPEAKLSSSSTIDESNETLEDFLDDISKFF
jgi:hypothetical protein